MLECVCASCDEHFYLTADSENTRGPERSTFLRIDSCESGGIYSVEVVCPWCGYVHDLME